MNWVYVLQGWDRDCADGRVGTLEPIDATSGVINLTEVFSHLAANLPKIPQQAADFTMY